MATSQDIFITKNGDSYQALREAIEADAECLISASAATDIFYMLRKAFQSAQKTKERIEQLSRSSHLRMYMA